MTRWPDADIQPFNATADGKRLVFLKYTRRDQSYLGEFANANTRLKPPRLTDAEANVGPTAWMPDSSALFVRSKRTGPQGIFKLGITNGSLEQVFVGPHDVSSPRVSPDGAWIITHEAE